ncbi:MAG: tRNA lysidine(34) synthetase TilS [Pseudomonadota bacterium]|jgi:tRNA(Ile)-lysidine synthase
MPSKFEHLKNLIEAKIRDFPLPERQVMVSCSGGVDSTALFWAFLELFQAGKIFSLRLFHFNFGLRGSESDGDEEFCHRLSRDTGVPLIAMRATVEERETRSGQGIQEWARRLRREAVASAAKQGEWIALAHHADDAAETTLMRIMRGTSPAGMQGMAEWMRTHTDGSAKEVVYFRPWLEADKEDILTAASERSILFREDSTNATLDYARNVVRHRVLPELLRLWPAGRQKLRDLAADAAGLYQYALSSALRDSDCHCQGKLANCVRQKLVGLPDSVAMAVLSHMVQKTAGEDHRQLSRANLKLILDAARKPAAQEPGGVATKFTLEIARGIFVEVAGDAVRSFPGPA